MPFEEPFKVKVAKFENHQYNGDDDTDNDDNSDEDNGDIDDDDTEQL